MEARAHDSRLRSKKLWPNSQSSWKQPACTSAQKTKLTGPKTPFKASETKTHERILWEKQVEKGRTRPRSWGKRPWKKRNKPELKVDHPIKKCGTFCVFLATFHNFIHFNPYVELPMSGVQAIGRVKITFNINVPCVSLWKRPCYLNFKNMLRDLANIWVYKVPVLARTEYNRLYIYVTMHHTTSKSLLCCLYLCMIMSSG